MRKKPKKTAKPADTPRPSPHKAPQPPAIAPPAPADEFEDETSPERPGPPVAGIGASAGGLDAFKKFFAAMPADSGVAFVLIPHLDPKHESLMVELMTRYTKMPVVEAAEGMPVEPNHVYVIPPNKYMTISSNVLRLTGPVERGGPQTSIDMFLRSLADDKLEKAICVILSGTGTHGALGLKAIKAAGGMAMVQDPATAEFPRMPQSAVATGLADYVLPAEKMPEALRRYIGHFYVNGGAAVKEAEPAADGLKQVLALLRARSKFDFRWYRKKMLARRVERRMGLNHFDNVGDYLVHLRNHPNEVEQLARDLLISVTSFFRDAEAFHALEAEVILPLIDAKETDTPLRVWVPGCATGEEAYSLAILFLERLAAAQRARRIQIFATDVDKDALEAGRQGVYPDSISADVSRERLARYFTPVEESSYQVTKQLRELIMFAAHNLLADAPFSRLDLISCRNLLIYLEPEAQKKVLALFHFALNEGGYLFLGPSETIGHQIDLFETVSKKWRIFRRIGPSRPERVEFPIATSLDQPFKARPVGEPGPGRGPDFAELTRRLILEQLGTAAVLVNRKYEILYSFGPAGSYLEFPPGEPTRDLTLMLREGLRSRLRAAVHKAVRENQTVVVDDIQVRRNGHFLPAIVRVTPVLVPRSAEGLLLVTFQDRPGTAALPAPSSSEDLLARQLEYELRATKEDLQSTIEEMESSNEELKAANEEVMSMNEELQSANEELETSKEELQSLNEELTTVNNQLQEKVEELEAANNDMANLLDCSDFATIFLDNSLRIKRFTPAATRLFHLIASDVGRPLSDVKSRLDDPGLLADAREVLQRLAPREKELSAAEKWWLRRVSPYRTADNRIEGVVITFVDISESRRADEIARRLAAIVESSADAIFATELDGTIRTWNRGAERLYGYTTSEAVGRSIRFAIPEDCVKDWNEAMSRLARGEHVVQLEVRRVRKDGQRILVEVTYSPLRDGAGKVIAASVIARDITERKHNEEKLRDSEEHLRAILNTAMDAIITIHQHGIIQSVNPATEQMFGYSAGELIGLNVTILMPSPYREEHDGYLESYLRTGQKRIIGIGREVHGRRKDGSVFPVDLAVNEIEHLKLFTGMIRDITRRKELEREVVEIASLQQHRIGQDLHDTVGQELTALNLVASDLEESIRTDPQRTSELIAKMIQGLQRSQRDFRAIVQGLLPVPVDARRLAAALADLADHTQQEGKLKCTLDCPRPITVADNSIATHLYLITVEAVHNAVKHAQARNIRITLKSDAMLVLTVQDDGVGMAEEPAESQGLGLRIMRNRAAIVGAKLAIEPADPMGTMVTCVLPRSNHEPG
jgi:two-component system CheB/CheR fusion protein